MDLDIVAQFTMSGRSCFFIGNRLRFSPDSGIEKGLQQSFRKENSRWPLPSSSTQKRKLFKPKTEKKP
jgi:hypothetical protein